jgi:hypothetical protein
MRNVSAASRMSAQGPYLFRPFLGGPDGGCREHGPNSLFLGDSR